MKKRYPTVIDQSCQNFDRIFVSAGKVGLQLEINPQSLAQLVGASLADIAAEEA